MKVFELSMSVLAGLVLFLYGVTRLAEGLRAIAGDRAKNLLARFTRTRPAGLATGTAATVLLDSSSVTIIMVIALVHAGLLTTAASLAVVMGANIGTTIGGQIVAFPINEYAPLALLAGGLAHFVGPTQKWRSAGLCIFGFGLLFYGLDTIENAMEPFRNHKPFLDLISSLEGNKFLAIAVGALFTVIVQSSSATLAIVITLAGQGLIPLSAGIAIALGAEIGTCADTLVATLGKSRAAVRTGLFHLVFNLITVSVGVVFLEQLVSLARLVSQGAGVGRQIANAQLAFNVLGALLFLGFLPFAARALERLLPNKQRATGPVNDPLPTPRSAP